MLQRQPLVAVEEEKSYGTQPTTRLTNPIYFRPRQLTVNVNPVIQRFEQADGGRDPARQIHVSKLVDYTIVVETDPLQIGWWLKWAGGDVINVDTTTGHYRVIFVGNNTELPSFSIYADVAIADYIGQGAQTYQFLGAKVSVLRLELSGDPEGDQTAILTISGIAQQPKVLTPAGDVMTGYEALNWSQTLLEGSTTPTPHFFKNIIVAYDGAAYSAGTNKWKRVALEIQNSLLPRVYANNENDLYLDDILLGSRRIVTEFDVDAKDDKQRQHDFLNATTRQLDMQLTHVVGRGESSPTNYQTTFFIPKFGVMEGNPIVEAAGGEDMSMRTYRLESLRGSQTTAYDETTATTSHFTTDLDPVTVLGSTGDMLFHEFTNGASDIYVTRIRLKIRSSGGSETADLGMVLCSDDGASPSRPTALTGGILPGGTANAVSVEFLDVVDEYHEVYWDFPLQPKLTASAVYWIGLYSLTNPSTTIVINGDATGTDSFVTSADGGASFSADTNSQLNMTVYGNDIPLVIEQYTDNTATYYPDAT